MECINICMVYMHVRWSEPPSTQRCNKGTPASNCYIGAKEFAHPPLGCSLLRLCGTCLRTQHYPPEADPAECLAPQDT